LGGRFVLGELIGSGGFADVYRAADRKQAGEPTAVKVLRDVESIEPEVIRRFRRELRILEALEHPHVIRVLGHGETDEEGIWYAMPLAQGSLADIIEDIAGRPQDILAVVRQVGAGLGYVHQHDVLHRDLKPANILRTERGWAISDFGLAAELERGTTILTSTTRAGLGSPWYSAPEQWTRARAADHLSDVYSLGKVIQELITGDPPVTSDMPAGPLRPVVQRATASRPGDRHQSVAELVSAVESALEAPSGPWESVEDAAKRLLEQVRLPKPSAEDLDDLLSWAQQLDETASDDMESLARVLPWISAWSVRTMWARQAPAFRIVFQYFCDYVAEQGFNFEYCDVLADFTRRVVQEVQDPALLPPAVKALAGLGYNHNRWHVRDVLVATLQSVRDDETAVAAAEGLRAAGRSAVDWSIQDFSLRSLHPTLRGSIGQFLEEAGDE
jgi:serine/threonine protein kinase